MKIDAQKHITKNHVCSIASIVVQSACVYLQELMETRKFVRAITIGRPKKEDQNVLELCFFISHHVLYHNIRLVFPQEIKENYFIHA